MFNVLYIVESLDLVWFKKLDSAIIIIIILPYNRLLIQSVGDGHERIK